VEGTNLPKNQVPLIVPVRIGSVKGEIERMKRDWGRRNKRGGYLDWLDESTSTKKTTGSDDSQLSFVGGKRSLNRNHKKSSEKAAAQQVEMPGNLQQEKQPHKKKPPGGIC